MVVGYLDTFVFEELSFAVGPVVEGIDGAFKGYARGCVAYEIYCCKKGKGTVISRICLMSWRAKQYGKLKNGKKDKNKKKLK